MKASPPPIPSGRTARGSGRRRRSASAPLPCAAGNDGYGERRTIPLNQIALELLKQKYGSPSVETELVFSSEAQVRLNASNISRSLNFALEKATMTDFHFDDLRHTCATRMVRAEWICARCNGYWGINRRS